MEIVVSEAEAPSARRRLRNLPSVIYVTAAVALVCLAMITMGVLATNQDSRAKDGLDRVYRNNLLATQYLDQVAEAYAHVLYQVDNLVLANDPIRTKRALELIDEAERRIDLSWRLFAELPVTTSAADREAFGTALARYRTLLRTVLKPMASELNTDADMFLPLREQLTDTLTHTVQSSIARLRAGVDAEADRALDEASWASDRSRVLTAVLTLAAVLLAIVLLAVTIRGLFALGHSHTVNRTDTLTGLANRLMLSEVLPQAADRAGNSGREVAVLLLDLDGFKQINDTLGHEAGDQVLRHFADMLRKSVRSGDTVVRQGGDEFAMIVEGLESSKEAVAVAERIQANLLPTVTIAGQKVQVRASIGIAVHAFPVGSDSAAERELLHQADLAMYASKRARTHSWQLYAAGGLETDEEGVELRDDLRRAVSEHQIEVHYQPIVLLPGQELIGLEALIRWRHPTRGLLQPTSFVAIAEETDIIHDLCMTVLETACRQVHEWQEQLPAERSLYVTVNVSARQLVRPNLAAEILDVLSSIGFRPADLVIEITETAFVEDDEALQQLDRLREQGVRIAVDDFGTGYSSISYLTKLPVDILKLDQSFVAKLNGQPEGSAVAEAVIRLGQALHLDTVAEGIETQAQATELTLLGCYSGQGYLFARPMPAEDTTALVLRSSARLTAEAPAGP